jgi:hypothetical protein
MFSGYLQQDPIDEEDEAENEEHSLYDSVK